MKEMTINIRVNEGWSNYPAQVKVKVDDELYKVLSIIHDNKKRSSSDGVEPEGSILYRRCGVMSKDSGFCWIHLPSQTHGQGIGMFYGGIAKGAEYIDLDMVRKEGEYRLKDLIKVR